MMQYVSSLKSVTFLNTEIWSLMQIIMSVKWNKWYKCKTGNNLKTSKYSTPVAENALKRKEESHYFLCNEDLM
jgi:hypothetical protein